ncbi:MAG: hypothetical protein KF859_10615 [Phycisphaeraceae bacterium]|nr:hypothetical protein [Phycisphaeraceae bacterium]
MNRHDPWAHRRGEPRLFIVCWAVYLLAASITSLGGTVWVGMVATDVYRPAARIMLGLAGLGVAVLWPMVRLCQAAPQRPVEAFAVDMTVVAMPVMVVAMAQSLPWMGAWPPQVSVVLSMVFVGWTLIVGALLLAYFSRPERRTPRWVCMLLVVALAGAGPAFAWGAAWAWPVVPSAYADLGLLASPITAPFEAVRDRAWSGFYARVERAHWVLAGAILAGGIVAVAAAARRCAPRHI